MSSEKQIDTKESGQEITTIKLTRATKSRLDHMRLYKRETYDEIVMKILEVFNICRVNPERARLCLISLDKQRRRPQKEKGPSNAVSP